MIRNLSPTISLYPSIRQSYSRESCHLRHSFVSQNPNSDAVECRWGGGYKGSDIKKAIRKKMASRQGGIGVADLIIKATKVEDTDASCVVEVNSGDSLGAILGRLGIEHGDKKRSIREAFAKNVRLFVVPPPGK